jgi:hypothetical protein
MPAQSGVLEAVGTEATTSQAVLEFLGEVPEVGMAKHEMLEEINLNAGMEDGGRENEEQDGQ